MKIKGTKKQAAQLSKKLGKILKRIRKPNPAMQIWSGDGHHRLLPDPGYRGYVSLD